MPVYIHIYVVLLCHDALDCNIFEGEGDYITPQAAKRARSAELDPSPTSHVGADKDAAPFWATSETVDVLRKICRDNGLKTSGAKKVLIDRIKERYWLPSSNF